MQMKDSCPFDETPHLHILNVNSLNNGREEISRGCIFYLKEEKNI